MKTLNKTALRLTVLLTALLCVTACDYVASEVIEIQAKDGRTIKLLCPVVDQNRSKITFIIDGECVVIK